MSNSERYWVLHGGSFNYRVAFVRSMSHGGSYPRNRDNDFGFRVVVDGTSEKVRRVLRGGSFYYNRENTCCVYRHYPDRYYRLVSHGLRVVTNKVRVKK